MKTNLKLLCTLSFILLNFLTNGQEPRTGEDINDTIVSLLQKLDNQKSVIIFENKDIIVKTSLSILENNFKAWLKEHPNLESDITLWDRIKQGKIIKNTINAVTIAKENELENRLNYRIASLLEQGKCMVTDKKTKKVLKTLKVQTFNFYCGPLCGEGGRRFFIGKTMFLKVRDWVS